jgi:DNA polymerase-4
MATRARIIMHIDMNSYFASCEQQENVLWRGLPLGVCEHLGGIIIAASIEAKRWGIKTAMPVWEARKLYPKIILTPTHPEIYRKYTHRFMQVLEDYTERVEKYSIDEAFVDLTKACNIRKAGRGKTFSRAADPWHEAERIAREIKRRITNEVGDWLKVSVGIGENKLVAKIASDIKKPNGLIVIRPEDKHKLYDQLKLTDIPGIARRMERRLNALGIKSLKDLRDYPASKLVSQFGILGQHLHSMGQLRGSWKEDFTPVEDDPLKSIGHVYTIPKEFRKPAVFEPVLYKLSEMVAARLRVNSLSGNVLSVYLRDHEYNGFGKSRNLGYYINDGREIYFEALALLRATGFSLAELTQNLYLIGVTVAGLRPEVDQQSLFASVAKGQRLTKALDQINTKYEDFTVARIPAWQARHIIRDSIGFGRMKEFKTSHVRGSHAGFS